MDRARARQSGSGRIPWLIRKVVDPQAEFLFVPTDQVLIVPSARGAPGRRALALALALALLLLPLLAACSGPRGAGPDATIYAAEKTGPSRRSTRPMARSSGGATAAT